VQYRVYRKIDRPVWRTRCHAIAGSTARWGCKFR